MTLHPLEILIKRRFGSVIKAADLTREIAKVTLGMEGKIRGVNCEESWYDNEVKTRGRQRATSISRYLNYRKGEKDIKLETETLLLLQKTLDCTLEELLDIYYSEFKPYNLSFDANDPDKIEGGSEPVAKIPIKQISKEFAQKIKFKTIIENEFGYKLVEYYVEAEYTKGRANKHTLRVKKTYKLLPLRDDIKEIKNFDYFRCLRNSKGDIEVPDYSTELFKIDPNKHLASDENSITLIFHKVLTKNQPVEFFISYFYEDVLDKDIGFHYVWILHPTDILKLKVTSTDPNANKYAKFRKHWFKGCPLGVERRIKEDSNEKPEIVSLVKGEKYFYKEVDDLKLFTTCGLYWEEW